MDSLENKHNNRNHILEVTDRLIMQKGVTKTSLADIAREAGISRGTLYYYYSSKSELVYDITHHHFDMVTNNLFDRVINAADDTSPQELLKQVFETILNEENRTKMHLYLLQDAVLNDEDLKNRFQDKYQEWRMAIKEGLDKVLHYDEERSALMSYIILAALDGFIIQSILGDESIPIDSIINYMIR